MFGRVLISLLFLLVSVGSRAQEKLISSQSLSERQEEISRLAPDEAQQQAREYARQHKLPERVVYRNGTVLGIRRLSSNGLPMYYKTHNLVSAQTISTDQVWEGGGAGLSLDGAGILVGIWDGGIIRSSHEEFEGRARVLDGSAEVIDHATHVAGTIGAKGIRPNARGMANRTTMDSYDWNNDNDEMENAASRGLLISNHSYGFVHGWEYNDERSRWEWWGDTDISETEDYNFGFYGSDARVWDEIASKYPYYLIVKSAGNDRGDGRAPGSSHYVFEDGAWRESTETRDMDGGTDGFDCIGTQGTSKNILTVGAVHDITGGYAQPSDVRIASFSGFGPTDDGRIKPDIVANGISLFSSISGNDTEYGYSSGTSMSTPSVSGSLALLQDQHSRINGSHMTAAQLKALVLHTADEAGEPGPDYRFGWGLMNTRKAAELISSLPEERFFTGTLEEGAEKEYVFFSRGQEEIRITLVWTDPKGKVPPAQLNPRTPVLVNDLDLALQRQVDDHLFYPYILDPLNPDLEAARGDNDVDNVEQIVVSMPMAGFYTLSIGHENSLSGGSQAFALVVSGLEKDYVASGTIVLEESNGNVLLTSADSYPHNLQANWIIAPENGLPVSLYFDWFETDTSDILTVYDGGGPTAEILARFSGTLSMADTLLVSSSDSMFLSFSSDDQGSGRGFLGRYCTVAPEGDYLITGEAFPCSHTSSSYFALGQEGAYFMWMSGEGWEIAEKSYNGIDLSIGEGSGLLESMPYNRCGEGDRIAFSIEALSEVPQLQQVQGDTMPCAGRTSLLYTDLSPGSSYQWTLPAGWAGSGTGDSLVFIPGEESGTVSVEAVNSCGTGNKLDQYLDVLNIPERVSILTDKVPPCARTSQEFYVDAIQGHSYRWEVADDWIILDGQDQSRARIQVGEEESFLYMTLGNKCGERETSRLFLTSPVPEDGNIVQYRDASGIPQLEVTNLDEFSAIQWYRNGLALEGESATSSPLKINLNGIYWVATTSDNACVNPGGEAAAVEVENDELAYLVYRVDENYLRIVNTTTVNVNYRIVNTSGQVLVDLEAPPGDSDVLFQGHGVFLLRFYGGGVDQNYKFLF